jgi:hypothetical protein
MKLSRFPREIPVCGPFSCPRSSKTHSKTSFPTDQMFRGQNTPSNHLLNRRRASRGDCWLLTRRRGESSWSLFWALVITLFHCRIAHVGSSRSRKPSFSLSVISSVCFVQKILPIARMIHAVRNFIKLQYYRYTVCTGLYMLDTTEVAFIQFVFLLCTYYFLIYAYAFFTQLITLRN